MPGLGLRDGVPGLGVERLIWGLGLDGGVAGWSEGVLVTGYKVSE